MQQQPLSQAIAQNETEKQERENNGANKRQACWRMIEIIKKSDSEVVRRPG